MHDELIARLAADLTAADYTVDALTALWGDDAGAALARGQRVPADRALAARSSALATLARLFVLGHPVAPTELDAALPQTRLAGAIALGLVDDAGEPLLDLRPYAFTDARGPAHWWIASDLGDLVVGRALREDHVLGVGGASLTLAGLLSAEPVAAALDLGTGCGIQAMHAARHATRVVATDISARALEIAAFNAALNGIHTIEFRHGSLFEPVAGERFGHVVSNPPFVITPRVEGVPAYEYRDGGLVGDALVASVIRGVGAHLAVGGVAQLLGNWEYLDGANGLDRVAAWLEHADADGIPLDAWVVEREVQSVEEYAETWIRDGGTRPGPEFDRLYAAWLDDFARRGVRRVGFGYVTLRRTAGDRPALRRLEHHDAPLAGGLGPAIAGLLDAHDWLARRDDRALAAHAFVVAPDVTEERHYWPGDENPAAITLRQGGGFARSVPCGTALAAVVGASDGTLSLGAICAAVADLLEVDAAALTAEVLPEARELVLTGLLRV